jgi:DNA-binding NarL/FixJ family response regulator
VNGLDRVRSRRRARIEIAARDQVFRMKEKKRIVIAEDHKILREGLRALLGGEQDVEVIGEAQDGLEAIRCVERLKPDLMLVDLSMPKMDGISVIKEIGKRFPETKMLVLTVHASEDYLIEALKSGAHGYCLKDASHAELMGAIQTVLSGKPYLSPAVSEKVLSGYLRERGPTKTDSSWGMITSREKEVLKLVGEGYKNKEIADYLYISVKTVEKHRSNLMRKLRLHTASALTAYAIEKGLVENPQKTP